MVLDQYIQLKRLFFFIIRLSYGPDILTKRSNSALAQVLPSFHLVYSVVLASIWLLVSVMVISFDAFCGAARFKMAALGFWGVWNIVIIYVMLLIRPSQVRTL